MSNGTTFVKSVNGALGVKTATIAQVDRFTRAIEDADDATPPAVEQAIEVLNASGRGRVAGKNLLRLLNEGGCGLDARGQHAILTLLDQYWNSGMTGTVLCAISDAFGDGK